MKLDGVPSRSVNSHRLVAVGRLIELGISRRNQRHLGKQGVRKVAEPHFRWMVLLHGGILVAAAVEVVVLHRPLIPALAIPMTALFVLSNVLRWWVNGTWSLGTGGGGGGA